MWTSQRGTGNGCASASASEKSATTDARNNKCRWALQHSHCRRGKYKIAEVPNGQRKMGKKSQVAWQNNSDEPLEGVWGANVYAGRKPPPPEQFSQHIWQKHRYSTRKSTKILLHVLLQGGSPRNSSRPLFELHPPRIPFADAASSAVCLDSVRFYCGYICRYFCNTS